MDVCPICEEEVSFQFPFLSKSIYIKHGAKKKMKDIVHRVVDFDDQDFETLAKDFDVSVKEAEELIELLKSCFDESGNFRKGTFGAIIPEFARFERRIFEFLWHYLKETLHQNDRSAFLNSLQLLVDRTKGLMSLALGFL